MSLEALMRTEAEILRPSAQRTPTGEFDESFEQVGSARCAVLAGQGSTERTASGEEIRERLVAYFPHGTDVGPLDRVVLEGRTYVCESVERGPVPRAPVRAHLRSAKSV